MKLDGVEKISIFEKNNFILNGIFEKNASHNFNKLLGKDCNYYFKIVTT